MTAYVPQAWPAGVSPPGSDDWERSAVRWLLGLLPGWRDHQHVHRYPAALASIAHHTLAGTLEGTRAGYRTVRTELGGRLPPPAIAAILEAYRAEGSQLAVLVDAVDLVERALRGERFKPRL